MNKNHARFLLLSRNIFCIIHSITTLVCIKHRGCGCKWVIDKFIVIDVCIATKKNCGECGILKNKKAGEETMKSIL